MNEVNFTNLQYRNFGLENSKRGLSYEAKPPGNANSGKCGCTTKTSSSKPKRMKENTMSMVLSFDACKRVLAAPPR
jgi:hypothetical protein